MLYKEKTKKLVNQIANELKIKNRFQELEIYVDMINEYNKIMNLTGFKDDKLWEVGIYESISLMHQIMNDYDFINKEMLDIGAGVGFPSVPFLIITNNFNLTIHEPIKKRIMFLSKVQKKLKLNMKLLNTRTEEVKQSNTYDIITARAVGASRILIEISLRILKVSHSCYFLKGPSVHDEIKDAKNIINKLSTKIEIIDNQDNNIKKKLVLLKVTKLKEIPQKFPRSWASIKKNEII